MGTGGDNTGPGVVAAVNAGAADVVAAATAADGDDCNAVGKDQSGTEIVVVVVVAEARAKDVEVGSPAGGGRMESAERAAFGVEVGAVACGERVEENGDAEVTGAFDADVGAVVVG